MIVTVEGTANAVVLLLIATATEPAAGLLSETVQVLDPLLPKLEGAQESDVSCPGTVA